MSLSLSVSLSMFLSSPVGEFRTVVAGVVVTCVSTVVVRVVQAATSGDIIVTAEGIEFSIM